MLFPNIAILYTFSAYFFILKKYKFNKWYYGKRLTKRYALVKNQMGGKWMSGIQETRMVKLMLKMVSIDHKASICRSNTPKKSACLLALYVLSSQMEQLKGKSKAFCIFGKNIIINQKLYIQY